MAHARLRLSRLDPRADELILGVPAAPPAATHLQRAPSFRKPLSSRRGEALWEREVCPVCPYLHEAPPSVFLPAVDLVQFKNTGGSRERDADRDTHTRDEHTVAHGTRTRSQTANPTTKPTHRHTSVTFYNRSEPQTHGGEERKTGHAHRYRNFGGSRDTRKKQVPEQKHQYCGRGIRFPGRVCDLWVWLV